MRIKLFQIKDIANVDYAFRDFNPGRFDFGDYEEVWAYQFPDCFEPTDEIEVCEHMFSELNFARAFGTTNPSYSYKGHSPSVSDVFSISGQYYYVNSFGFEKIPMICLD